jgi:hypothetical protein
MRVTRQKEIAMSISIQLARIFSVYLILMGLSMLINRSFYRAAVKEMASNNIAMLLVATITLTVGVVLISLHNLWVHDWRVTITLFCWLIMFSGIVRTLFPTFVQGMAGRLTMKNGSFVRIVSFVCLILGVFYGYLGFH